MIPRKRPLTDRQRELLEHVCRFRPVSTGDDGSVLRALEKRGLVYRSHNGCPGGFYYTWGPTKSGEVLNDALGTVPR